MHVAIRALGMTGTALLGAGLMKECSNYFRGKVVEPPAWSVTNKVAFVTGATSGIGLAFTQSLLDRKCTVYATFRNEGRSETLRKMAEQYPELLLVKADFDTEENLNTAIAETQKAVGNRKVDLLVLNAGYFEKKANKFGTLEGAALAKSFQVNTIAPLMMTQALSPNLDKSDKPTVVFISSRRGSIARNREENYQGRLGYVSSKTAANSIFSSLSMSLTKYRILLLHPDAVLSNFPSVQPDRISPEESVKGMISVIESPTKTGTFVDRKGRSIPW
ncbi:SDR family NAD(P)-dependent oxidoreductase [Endozoicomonas atrinae]|uniref:SDR family NAD(P)-dependent oxidoreductase n=1 Tax=Endozoicomonas atrinae TaxID=1333660 RepID=UPI0009F6CF9C|nr:SDR family NAD(P)-dependent oxidoreductase [Endozoicomonas atrinae]